MKTQTINLPAPQPHRKEQGQGVQSRFRIYRCGKFGYAYNPNVKLWEVYEFDRDCGYEIIDLLGHENTKRQAHGDALRRNDHRRHAVYEESKKEGGDPRAATEEAP